MTSEGDDSEVQSVALAGALMAHLAGNLSAKFDTFATWLLAGFGAAVGLLLTSHEVSSLVPAATIRWGAKLFLAAVCVTVVEKYLSIIVAAGSEGAEFSRSAFEDHFKGAAN
jgi:ABC-type Fe3+-siderophore transport system permease subunit